MKQSIYLQILNNIKNGMLDGSFCIDEDQGDDQAISWAPGARDGVAIYHTVPDAMDELQKEKMIEALKSTLSSDNRKTDELFYEWTKTKRAVEVIDDLEGYVIDHEKDFDLDKLYRSAVYLIMNSRHIECVKIGLELTEIVITNNEMVKQAIRNLGLYDEFTIFAAFNMRRWKNGNEELFELARKVHGWGRIHCVELLEPDSEKIRHWLLTEGTVNDVMNAYSSLTCWNKAKAQEVLYNTPTYEEYEGLSLLIEGLVDEGPVSGMSAIDKPEEVLDRFLEISKTYDLSVKNYDVILSIRDYSEENGYQDAVEKCDLILHSIDCEAKIKEALKKGNALKLADVLNIPAGEDLYRCLEEDFASHYRKCLYLMNDEGYADKTIELFTNRLLCEDGENSFGSKDDFMRNDQLQFILQSLSSYPLKGIELIKAGLNSTNTRNRYLALSVLKAWCENRKEPLDELSGELYEIIGKMKDNESDEASIKLLAELIDMRF
ncbi:MAG: hypothetical protein IKF80_03035 [Erysipelotrichaceae bacterium]|nr:hypothetical protein [Erysipelotrichaceae bacterium]